MGITKQQIVRIQSAMSSRCGSRDERLDYLSGFFEREVQSTKELTSVEADDIIYFLNVGKVKENNWGAFDKQNSKHRVILSLLYQAKWVCPHPCHGEVPDIERFSAFLKSSRSPVNKPLKKMSGKELEKIIKAFKGVVRYAHR